MSGGPEGGASAGLVIEETDEERSIITPELRLRFRWIGDRWSHAIDLGPGPWQTAADSIEGGAGAEEPGVLTYQEVQLQRDGDDVLALALGRSGPHHASAAFRVRHTAYECLHFQMKNILQKRSISRVEIDVADRCRVDAPTSEARYRVHVPPIVYGHLDDSLSCEAADEFRRDWQSGLLWEADVEGNYHVALEAWAKDWGAHVSVVEHEPSGHWIVRAAAVAEPTRGTNRFRYAWEHHRVRVVYLDQPGA